jgi:4-hydroxy-3-methylbut-2-en-1-yl diphosphate synthase IspG/GcpE
MRALSPAPDQLVFKGSKRARKRLLIEKAIEYHKPVRIGVNWGSLDAGLLARMMDANARSTHPQSAAAVMREALVESAIGSAQRAEELGLPGDRIVLSASFRGPGFIAVYASRAELRLPAAPRPDRGRDGEQGYRGVDRGDGRAAAGGDR